ncbi:MAG: hypothetical protein KDK70_14480, partial [Myxococcales bacterium]|nr:hypothetical protein [Myxococcales bacterium]
MPMLSCSALLTLGLLATPPGPSGEPTRPGRSTSTEVASGHLDRRGPALEFDEAVGASAEAPALQRLDAAVEDKRRADAELPRLTQNPQLQVMPGGRLPPASDPGFELQTTLTQGWNLEGYGRERKKAARAETEVLAAEARALAMERR